MTKLSLSQVIILLVIGIVFISGCGNDRSSNHQEKSNIAKVTDIDLVSLTTFSNPKSVCGTLVYVPIYSSTFHQAGDWEFLLTVTLSIHNIDLNQNIEVSAVSFFDTKGEPVGEFVSKPITIKPLATRQFVIPETDKMGGTGANFLVKWESEKEVVKPIIEALMISTSSGQGISFTTQGTVIQKLQHSPNTSVNKQTTKEEEN